MFPSYARCTVREPTVSPLCAACPCERQLNFGHLAARCTTTSPGPLRGDSSLLHESTPSHHTGDSTRRTLFQHSTSFFVFLLLPMPSSRALWAPARGVSQRLGGGQGHLKKREDFLFWMWCQVLTLLLDHGGKQAAKKRISGLRSLLVSRVRCQIFSGYSQCGRFLCCFCLWYSHKSIATEMLLACGEDSK